MSRPTSQHYVPRFYLREFTFDGGTQLHVFDKHTGRTDTAGVRNVASERGFYDDPPEIMQAFLAAVERGELADHDPKLVEAAANPHLIDDELTEFETAFHRIYRLFLDDVRNERRLPDECKTVMAYYLVKQYLRTREARQLLVELAEKVKTAQAEAQLGISLKEANLRLKYDEAQVPLLHAKALFDPKLIDSLVSTLAGHIWRVGKNTVSQPLYTSDHPVVLVPHAGGRGLGSRGIEIAFPLDPAHILTLYEREHFAQYVPYDGLYYEMDLEAVERFNFHQLQQSYRLIYCSEDAFAFAEQICIEHPEFRNPNRERVLVMNGGEIRRSSVAHAKGATNASTRPRIAIPRRALKRLARQARSYRTYADVGRNTAY